MRMIEADKIPPLIRLPLMKHPKVEEIMGLMQFIIDEFTVDAVPVVRCKDCKYRDPENYHCDHAAGTMIYFPRKPDDFCSYGERSEHHGATDGQN